ncbi:MAG: MAE_28990/MAE_18760 family HEPN-like nuclease [Dehalococcoidia bacterium]|nr:MAE_28990/MAE_18760 family HEPN-like nuclease [Dehalococcoidia bacterium]
MTVRTLEELQDLLNNELAWRKKELTTLKFSLDRCREHERPTFARAAICLLYAHWEGYIKAAANAYLEYVARRRLAFRHLSYNFVALGLKSDFVTAGVPNAIEHRTAIVETLLAGLNRRPNIPFQDSIDAGSNLNSQRLREILGILGFDTANYMKKKALIDERLLRSRNNVAHGTYLPIESGDYEDLYGEVLRLLEQFRTDVENSAATQKYRRL